MKKICVVTSSRADYGLLKPLISRLSCETEIDLSIVATGMHLCHEFGNTLEEILKDGFLACAKINIQEPDDTPAAMSRTMGNALIRFAGYFEKSKPDLLLVLGDRYEIMAVCCASVNQQIPIAHIHGGEITEGAIDECYRHSITKMSTLHFTSCEAYRKRVIQLGEKPDMVFNVGALGVENAISIPLLTLEGLEESLGFTLHGKPYGVITFHPVTLENEAGISQLNQLLNALKSFKDMNFIITKSNSDTGGRKINSILEKYCEENDNCYLTASLGMERYLSALKYASVVIGNSSSGIIEAPSFKVATVNIGDRQKGRIAADTVIDCTPDEPEIIATIKKALSPEFRKATLNTINPYGNGDASKKIVEIIKKNLVYGISIKKEFFNIDFNYNK